MAKNKTTETDASVADFLAGIANEKKRKDCISIIDLVSKESGYEPKMWGPSIVGFGSYHYKYESGREGDAPLAGIASRSTSITFYLGSEFKDRETLLKQLGKHKTSGGCLHIQKLEDIDTNILIQMFTNSMEQRKLEHQC